MGLFDKIKQGLIKTREQIKERTNDVFSAFVKVDEALFEELEEVLIMCDVGANTSDEIIERLRQKVKEEHLKESEQVKLALQEIIADLMSDDEAEAFAITKKPLVLLVIGVNGVGKTTSIAKLAALYKEEGKKVMLAAADTFRAAAIEQLDIWANRIDVDIIKQAEGSDPAAVVYDALTAAKARGADVLICDTAGRLHNKVNLMNELAKINRIIDREAPDAQKEVFLVLDATTGQNALSQVKSFGESAGITGIVLTKLDGTAKGGIVIAIKNEQKIPVRYIGIGEKMNDLQPFSSADNARALFE